MSSSADLHPSKTATAPESFGGRAMELKVSHEYILCTNVSAKIRMSTVA